MTGSQPLPSTFETGGPARVTLDVRYGSVAIRTAPRSTTAVTVRPARPGRRADEELASLTRVELVAGGVRVIAPKHTPGAVLRPGAVDVCLDVPEGSSVSARTGYATVTTEGRLGECEVRGSYGDVHLDRVGRLTVDTPGGRVRVDEVEQSASVKGAYGAVHLGAVTGQATVRNSYGDVSIGTLRGDLTLRTAYGQVHVQEASSGSIDLATGYGAVTIGVAAGTVVGLDVTSTHSAIVNTLQRSEPPSPGGPALLVRVRSGYGAVTIQRAAASATLR